MQVLGTTQEEGRLGFKTHLAPSTVSSQCDLECGPKVIPWRCLRSGAATTREGGRLGFKTHLAPSTVPSQYDSECGPKVMPWRGLRAGPGDHPGRGAPWV